MATNKTAPTAPKQSAGARSIVHYKGTKKLTSTRQKALLSLLSDGSRYTTRQMSKLAPISSPTKEVQRFRDRGINVQDEWVEATKTIPRHKRYWINPSNCIEEEGKPSFTNIDSVEG